ncbi:MAG: restriction endonuclease [Caldilineaceae bacterium]
MTVYHTYTFARPKGLNFSLRNLQSSALWIGTIGWFVLYGWLAYRLWTEGLRQGLMLNLLLTAGAVLLGVLLVLIWRRIGWRWWRGVHQGSKWPALSLGAMYALTPSEFEDYVTYRLFARQGYRVYNTPDTKDGGVDILVTDRHEQQAVVQCKRYKGTVGSATVRDLYGTMVHAAAAHAYLVTTGNISEDAREWSAGKPITLIDGRRLEQLAKATPGRHAV